MAKYQLTNKAVEDLANSWNFSFVHSFAMNNNNLLRESFSH